MSKYGWTRGSGLGADESGIINPLRVQVEKRRKKADADGGGWAEPGSKGKIIGGKRKEENAGKFGTMSDVIVLRDMLENMPNLQEEIAGGLGQEIGEECGEKVCWYRLQTMLCFGTDGDGTVRTCGEIIHRPGEPQGLHQIHKPGFGTQSEFFFSYLIMIQSANHIAQAVNELDGRVFNGNTIIPEFYDTEKFEQGIYN